MEEIDENYDVKFASRKKRLFGFIIDIFIIGLFGYLSGLIFEGFYIQIGNYGKIVGFLITWLYFSIFDSKIFNGQSIGKKICKIKVVNKTNDTLTIKESSLRSLIYSLTVLLNGASFKNMKYFPVIILIGIILFSIYVLEVYLFIFNKPSKQTLHDLLSKSYVVNIESDKVIDIPQNIKVIRFAFFIPLIIAILTISINVLMKNTFSYKMLPLIDNIQNQLPLRNTTINNGMTKSIGPTDNSEFKYIYLTCIKLNQNDFSDELAVKVAEIVINSQLSVRDGESLIIQINSGYDIGISNKYKNIKYNKPVIDWQKDIDKLYKKKNSNN